MLLQRSYTLFAWFSALMLLAACMPGVRPPVGNDKREHWPGPEISKDRPTLIRKIECPFLEQPETVKIEENWVADQVIVTGSTSPAFGQDAGEVDFVIQSLAALDIKLQQIGKDCLIETSGGTEEERKLLGNTLRRDYAPSPEQIKTVTTRLYTIADGRPPIEIVRAVNEIAKERRLFVFADLNRVVSGAHSGDCPSVSGQPHSVGNGPFGDPTPALTATENQFLNQWAFTAITGGAPLTTTRALTGGADILVGVFDTSPFSGTVPPKWLAVVPHSSVPGLPISTSLSVGNEEHGLFVAGLIHAVAPASPILLIPVLDQHGCGLLSTLAIAVEAFVATAIELNFKGAVLNLSLGIPAPVSGTEEDEELESLAIPTFLATLQGAMLVSATGNDSGGGAIYGPLRPALYDYVLGVAGTAPDGTRACYSNRGWVAGPYFYDTAAPSGAAGEGDPDGPGPEPLHTCAPLRAMCTDATGTLDSACLEQGILSRVTPATSASEFAYWSGTSFATPLVSGVAALCLGKYGGALDPFQVMDKLMLAAQPDYVPDLQTGVLRIPADCR